MSTLRDRLAALLTSVLLPEIVVDHATFRRLQAMQERLITEDPTLADEPGRGLDHVVYAAICGGLAESERNAGVKYDENTGERLDGA